MILFILIFIKSYLWITEYGFPIPNCIPKIISQRKLFPKFIPNENSFSF